ncbi:hypothetical protein [Pseudoxanthomonas suwonensis]|uniref:Uncharacterized protein n=1 Tax=Pseudoxanthomonas suwonensis TaxID=314722 RepID=A0A0E3Z0X0_9GAMM|nr:hypothetical protein [Pseudoxanthomonas suwonensis]AKC86252.1 hypothetical protein WQ53_05135 [Pseudoxanthomonas suwonensis]
MPLAESNPAAALTFDAAVHRALSRRLSDTPWPPSGGPATHSPAPATGDAAREAAEAQAAAVPG